MKHRVLALFFGALAVTLAAEPNGETGVRLHVVGLGSGKQSVHLALAIFDEKRFSIQVVDNAAPGDQPRFNTLAAAMEGVGCVAGCNGGFFDRRPFEPFGLMISDGREFGKFDPGSWMNGLLVVRVNRATLEPCPSFNVRTGVVGLLQAGPWLVRKGSPEPGLDSGRQAARTFVCHDDHGTWAIGISELCTLSELASLLTHTDVKKFIDIQQALNLDGGPSTGLWVKGSPGNYYVREGWPVRNYLGLVPRP